LPEADLKEMRKTAIYNKKTGELNVYTAFEDASKSINKSSATLNNWRNKSKIKETKEFILFFEVSEHKAEGKKRSNSF